MSPLPRPATLAILGLAVLAPATATRAAAPAHYRFSYRVRHRQQPHGETSIFYKCFSLFIIYLMPFTLKAS